MNVKRLLIGLLLISITGVTSGQGRTKRALFLGNSYTAVNNLPQLTAQLALSAGDTLYTDNHTPGGYTLMGHSTNATSLAKLAQGSWDYVVLQEQSQLPSFPIAQVEAQVFPYARILDSLIHLSNSCAQTVFYMTWGRKNGDAQNCATWPPVCTYSGMDSLLRLRYEQMALRNQALLSPVGAVWNYLRLHHPGIELYQPDESHPSTAGSYAAACCFYTTLFEKDPSLISDNAGLSQSDATAIRLAVKQVVFANKLQWYIGAYAPEATFTYTTSGSRTVTFDNQSLRATNYRWFFGDGNSSVDTNPVHTYAQDGNYIVTLRATSCSQTDSFQRSIAVSTTTGVAYITGNLLKVYPNPASQSFTLYTPKNDWGETYLITDICGRVMASGIIRNTETNITIQHWANGVYWLSIRSHRIKLIKI